MMSEVESQKNGKKGKADAPSKNELPRFQINIGTKFVLLIAILLVLVVASVNWITAESFLTHNQSLITDINVNGATDISSKVGASLSASLERSRAFAKTLLEENESALALQKRIFFEKNPHTLGLFILKNNSTASSGEANNAESKFFEVSQEAIASSDLNLDPSKIISNSAIDMQKVAAGESEVLLLPHAKEKTVLVIVAPFIRADNSYTHSLLMVSRLKVISDIFHEVAGISGYLVDKNGALLAKSPELTWTLATNLREREIVKQALSSRVGDGQLRFIDPDTQSVQLGVFRSIGFGGLKVLTEILESRAFAASKQAKLRTALIAIVILCFSLMLTLFFADSITYPIGLLSSAAKSIGQGDFKTRVQIKTHDELTWLGNAFNEMAEGLEEREKVKSVFNKFHSKEIVQLLLNGEVKLGGERKEIAILFSDIRNFTQMSEELQPEEVIEMINEYLSVMVTAIRSNHGIIDKFVGDAIIAIWGIPDSSKNDIPNSVKAALAMREALAELNAKRMAKEKPLLNIGIGIHYGPAIAGNVGSDEKMEYTVLGDSVNLASRVETLTKQLETDILITEVMAQQVSDQFVLSFRGVFKVKGKSGEVGVYSVVKAVETHISEKDAA